MRSTKVTPWKNTFTRPSTVRTKGRPWITLSERLSPDFACSWVSFLRLSS